MAVKDRVKELREKLGLSQEEVATRAGGKWTRVYVAKIETGQNKVSSHDAREALARGLGLNAADLTAYLHDEIKLERAVQLARAGAAAATPRELVREPEVAAREPEEDETALETALFRAMDPARYEPRDFDAARTALREAHRYMREHLDLDALARDHLEAARSLRLAGLPVHTTAILARMVHGKNAASQARADEVARGLTAEARERARAMTGGEPEDFPALPRPKRKS